MKVCWNVTNKCNANCTHCFRNTQEEPLSIEQNLQILENIAGVVDTISFSGGEVFLYENIFELIAAAKKKGMTCSIITNAILINKSNIDKILSLVDKITFSIDSVDDLKNARIGRGEGYCKHLNEVIDYINRKYPSFPITINTVITRENYNEIPAIYKFLRSKKIQLWKLMRFCPYRDLAKKNKNFLEITDAQFLEIKKNAGNLFNINAVVQDIDEIEQQFVISPAGNLASGQNNEDLILLPQLYNRSPESIKSVLKEKSKNDSLLDINLNLYKTFYTVAKAGSISAASKMSYISQPAISKSIKRIESDLNVTLFNRSLNGVVLTKQGEKLLYYIETAFNNILTAERSLKEDDSFNKGYLKIGTPSHIGTFFIFNIVKEFRANFPNIKISVVSRSTKELLELLDTHEIDFIIDAAPVQSNDERLTIVPLEKVRHCFFYNAQDKDVYKNVKSLKDLEDKSVVLPVSRSSHRKNLNAVCSGNGVMLSNVLEIETSEMIVKAVRERLGAGYVLYDFVKHNIERGEFCELKTDVDLPEIELVLVYYEDYLTAVPKHFLKSYILNRKKK